MAIEVDPGLFTKTGLDTPPGAMAAGQASAAPRGTETRDYVVLEFIRWDGDDETGWIELGKVTATSRPTAWAKAVRLWPRLHANGTEEVPVRAHLVPERYWQEITAGSKLEPFVEGL